MTIILLIIGILLVVLNTIALKKEQVSFNFNLTKAEEDMTEVDIKIGELRKEFAETILDIQKEIETLKSKNEVNNKELIEKYSEEILNSDENNISENNSIKLNEIDRLLKSGVTVEEIAEKLNISKGEVLLIKQLYLR